MNDPIFKTIFVQNIVFVIQANGGSYEIQEFE
jgi:hypothetical protein